MPKQSSKKKSSEPAHPKPEGEGIPVSKYQKFEAVTIHRGEIKNAPYNPRVIDAHARKKLKERIKKTGLIETLVWNKRSGVLVSGHQRLSILDDLEGEQDYHLTVAVVDLDEKTEKEMNVFLNNAATMGNYDLDLLGDMLKFGDIEIEGLGFDNLDLQMMFEGDTELEGFFDEKKDEGKSDIDKIEKMKKARKDWKNKADLKDMADFYFVVVFQTRVELEQVFEALNIPKEDIYIDGRKFATLAGIELQTAPVDPLQGTAEFGGE